MTDAAFVHERRAHGVGWQTLARMLGKPELDLRRRYDPDYSSPYAPPEPRRTAPVTRPVKPRESCERGGRIARVMGLLYASHPHFVSMHELGGHTGANAVACLRARHGEGVIESLQGAGYRLTKAGLDVFRDRYSEGRSP